MSCFTVSSVCATVSGAGPSVEVAVVKRISFSAKLSRSGLMCGYGGERMRTRERDGGGRVCVFI